MLNDLLEAVEHAGVGIVTGGAGGLELSGRRVSRALRFRQPGVCLHSCLDDIERVPGEELASA